MVGETPRTPKCEAQRKAGENVSTSHNLIFSNWPQNRRFRPPLWFRPKSLSELANAVRQAESAGHHVRAFGGRWSMSDAVCATDGGAGAPPGAMIETTLLNASLQDQLPQILANGVSATSLFHVEAGITMSALQPLLDKETPPQALAAGGGSGQTLGGMISTSTHGGDSTVPPLGDSVQAIHLVGAGGVEHWIERDAPITTRAGLQAMYPCLGAENIHYTTRLFNAVMIAAGSMGAIYSVVLKTVPQFGLIQHRVLTTWQVLLGLSDASLTTVLDGTLLSSWNEARDSVGISGVLQPPFLPNAYTEIVLNPYPLYPNDRTLAPFELARAGQNLCFVTNRVVIPPPAAPENPAGGGVDIATLGTKLGGVARDTLGPSLEYDAKFLGLARTVSGDASTAAAELLDFLGSNFPPCTISAVISYLLRQIVPPGERSDISYKMAEVANWGQSIRGLGVEAAFAVPDAVAFVGDVLALVDSFATRKPADYIGGYLSLRFVGTTAGLLGMQQWSPTCCVEYVVLAGSRGADEFVGDLQRMALARNGILHFGLNNDVMTAGDMVNAHGQANVDAFRRARGTLSNNGGLATFDNSFTDRLGLSAIPTTTDISYLVPLL